jgi:hypothetical protein
VGSREVELRFGISQLAGARLVSHQSHASPDTLLVVLTKTFSISARYFMPLWSIPAIFALPMLLLFDLLVWTIENYWRNTDLASITDWIGLVCTSIAVTFCSFLIVGEVSDVCFGGATSISKAISKTSIIGVVRLFGTNFIVWVLMAIAFFIVPMVLFFLGALVRLVDVTMPTLVTAFTVIGSGAATLVVIPFLFTDQMVVIERCFWLSALRSSASLVARSKAASFGTAFVAIALLVFPYVAAGLLTYGVVPLPFRGLDVSGADLPASLGGGIVSSILDAAFVPIQNIYLTVAYYSIRRRAGIERHAAPG